jgi:hypothetical protein
MLTMAQRRRRARVLKTGVAVAVFAIVLTPKIDDFKMPDIGFPLIGTAIAAPLE